MVTLRPSGMLLNSETKTSPETPHGEADGPHELGNCFRFADTLLKSPPPSPAVPGKGFFTLLNRIAIPCWQFWHHIGPPDQQPVRLIPLLKGMFIDIIGLASLIGTEAAGYPTPNKMYETVLRLVKLSHHLLVNKVTAGSRALSGEVMQSGISTIRHSLYCTTHLTSITSPYQHTVISCTSFN